MRGARMVWFSTRKKFKCSALISASTALRGMFLLMLHASLHQYLSFAAGLTACIASIVPTVKSQNSLCGSHIQKEEARGGSCAAACAEAVQVRTGGCSTRCSCTSAGSRSGCFQLFQPAELSAGACVVCSACSAAASSSSASAAAAKHTAAVAV